MAPSATTAPEQQLDIPSKQMTDLVSEEQHQVAAEQELPLTPEEVTLEWLSSVLGHKLVSFERIGEVLLATASKLFIKVTYDEEDAAAGLQGAPVKPTFLCLKGGFNPAIVAQYGGIVIRMYQKEVSKLSTSTLSLSGL